VFKEEILPYLRKRPTEAGSHYIKSQREYVFSAQVTNKTRHQGVRERESSQSVWLHVKCYIIAGDSMFETCW
jgi:hypothetical protein